ncbi:putative RING finger protein [Hordeum vulgare]|nr:putative RING finger protein [Hordeum vulgare]
MGVADAPDDDIVDLALAAAMPVEEVLKTVNALSNVDGLNCPICMEDDDSATWKETPCGHRFHGRCVERWLQAKGSCPMCRRQVVTLPAAAAASTSTAVFSNSEVVEYRVEDAIMEFIRESASYHTPL